jgi:hypothetical protein
MKFRYIIAAAFLVFFLKTDLSAQNKFSECSAIFLNQKMVVDDYSPNGKCLLKANAKGTLTVSTAIFENDKWRAEEQIGFKVTIKDGSTNTLLSYSEVSFFKIDIQSILSKCKKGDSILISVLKDKYALPHNEILVQ